jgi:hypothetical protein
MRELCSRMLQRQKVDENENEIDLQPLPITLWLLSKVDDLCVSARLIGVTHVCATPIYVCVTCLLLFYNCNILLNLAIRICDVVPTPDYSRPNVILTSTISIWSLTKKGEAPFAVLSPLDGLIAGWPPHMV